MLAPEFSSIEAWLYVAGPAFPEQVLEVAGTPMTLVDPYAS